MSQPHSSRPWTGNVEVHDVLQKYTPEVFEKIANALKVSPIPRLSGQIMSAVHNYYVHKHLQIRPGLVEVRQRLNTLRKEAHKLSQQICAFEKLLELEQSDDMIRQELLPPQGEGCRPEQLLQETRQNATTLQPFIEHLKTILARLPPERRGRRREWALKEFLRQLSVIYQEHKGKAPKLSRQAGRTYSGPFFRFVLACFVPLDDRYSAPHNHQALGDHLDQMLKKRPTS